MWICKEFKKMFLVGLLQLIKKITLVKCSSRTCFSSILSLLRPLLEAPHLHRKWPPPDHHLQESKILQRQCIRNRCILFSQPYYHQSQNRPKPNWSPKYPLSECPTNYSSNWWHHWKLLFIKIKKWQNIGNFVSFNAMVPRQKSRCPQGHLLVCSFNASVLSPASWVSMNFHLPPLCPPAPSWFKSPLFYLESYNTLQTVLSLSPLQLLCSLSGTT